jgi:polysaccharide export outer membrane protein
MLKRPAENRGRTASCLSARAVRTFSIALGVALLLVVGARPFAARAQGVSEPSPISALGAGDSVTVQIYGEQGSTDYVGDDGSINVPYVGKIPVAGVSPVEAASRIAKALKDGKFFVDPHVTVLVTQTRSQMVSVVGEVGTAGRYQITPRTTLLDLVAQAGGLKEEAADIGYILRTDETGRVNRYPVNLNVVKDTPDAPSSWILVGGDSLVVPRAERFSIDGEVTAPGRYRIEQGMTVTQAIARAGGVTERGSEHRVRLRRLKKPGEYQTIHPKAGDLVQAGDIITVKESIF